MSKQRTFSDYERKTVYAQSNGRCAICGRHIKYKKATIDHKRPLSRGGSNDFRNLQITCKSCNLMKHYLTQDEFYVKLWKLVKHNFFRIVRAVIEERGGEV